MKEKDIHVFFDRIFDDNMEKLIEYEKGIKRPKEQSFNEWARKRINKLRILNEKQKELLE